MRRLPLCLTLCAALALPAVLPAGVVDCASLSPQERTQAEAIGVCTGGAPKSVCLPATDAGLDALVDLLGDQANYQPTVPCETKRRVDGHGVLVAAGPGDGACNSEARGQEITNPQPVQQVAISYWRSTLNEKIRDKAARKAAEAEERRAREAAEDALVNASRAPNGPGS